MCCSPLGVFASPFAFLGPTKWAAFEMPAKKIKRAGIHRWIPICVFCGCPWGTCGTHLAPVGLPLDPMGLPQNSPGIIWSSQAHVSSKSEAPLNPNSNLAPELQFYFVFLKSEAPARNLRTTYHGILSEIFGIIHGRVAQKPLLETPLHSRRGLG